MEKLFAIFLVLMIVFVVYIFFDLIGVFITIFIGIIFLISITIDDDSAKFIKDLYFHPKYFWFDGNIWNDKN